MKVVGEVTWKEVKTGVSAATNKPWEIHEVLLAAENPKREAPVTLNVFAEDFDAYTIGDVIQVGGTPQGSGKYASIRAVGKPEVVKAGK